MFLECFLGQAVKCESGNGAFEARSGETPRAVRTAPAGEVVPLDPDQAFTHTPPAFCVLGLDLGHIKRASAESGLLAGAGDYFPRN
jgi:hypothetical protein